VRRLHTFALAFAIAALCLVAGPAASSAVSSAASVKAVSPGAPHTHSRLVSGTYTPLDKVPATAEVVTVGTYWVDIYGVDFQSDTCYITAYVWFNWTGKEDPTASLEFANAVEEWQLTTTKTYVTPKTLANGSKYQELRVNGRFYEPYDLRDYPLDTQQISLYLEDTRRTVNEAVYLADTENSGLDASMHIPGWTVSSLTSQAFVHDYLTDFGDTSAGPDATKFTSLVYSVQIERDIDYFYWKLIFPLIIVLLTNWLALLLRPHWIDLRTAMPATALLTAVFLQITYTSGLPETAYLVLMDKIYVLAYAMIVITLVQIIWSNHRLRQHEQGVVHEVRRLDVASAIIQFSVFWSVLVYLVVTR
jgi:hypothetical protein